MRTPFDEISNFLSSDECKDRDKKIKDKNSEWTPTEEDLRRGKTMYYHNLPRIAAINVLKGVEYRKKHGLKRKRKGFL